MSATRMSHCEPPRPKVEVRIPNSSGRHPNPLDADEKPSGESGLAMVRRRIRDPVGHPPRHRGLHGSLVTVDRTELLERSETYVQLVGFDGLPSTLTGTGVAVCIVDSGIDLTHPDLASVSLSGWTDLVNEDTAIR